MNKQNLPEAFSSFADISNPTKEDILKLNYKLMALLSKRTQAYTMGESTSITTEEIMLLKNSWHTIEDYLVKGKWLHRLVLDSAMRIGNIAYDDTVSEIGKFFERYNYRFFAHEIPCSIDYQLCQPVKEDMQGIEYINEYLKHLYIENMFCQKFSNNEIIRLLKSYCLDYKGLLINIFEPVVTNSIGLSMLNQDVASLDITPLYRGQLYKIMKYKTEEELQTLLIEASENLCKIFKIIDITEQEYIKASAVDLLPRIIVGVKNGSLDGVFISLDAQYENYKSTSDYQDGEPMIDEDLRELIQQFSMCSNAEEKIRLVSTKVHSLRDLVEILNTSFWGDECNKLLETLDKETISLLKKHISLRSCGSPTGWEEKLLTLNP